MKSPSDENQILERLRHYCSQSEKCKKDVKEKLRQWKYAEPTEKLIEILVSEGFIDEKRYTHSYAADKLKFAKWGKSKIVYALRNKGIPDELIQQAVANLKDNDYATIIEKELVKKLKSLKETDKYKIKQKLLSFAFQRGYESDSAYAIIEKLINL